MQRREIFWYGFAGVVIAVMLVGFGLWSKDQGSQIIVTAPPGVQIFVNGDLEGQTGTLKREVSIKKGAGEYAVIAAKDGNWPWMKNISLAVNEHKTLLPFLIPRDVKKEQILAIIPSGIPKGKGTVENPKYAEILSYLDENALPLPNISSEVAGLLPGLLIEDVKVADFYPGRRDVLIISAKNQVFVIDALEGEPRNFHPLYSGKDPVFILKKQILHIKDGDLLYTIDLSSL